MSKSFTIGLVIAALIAFFIGGTLTGPSETEVQEDIGNALVENCEDDLQFRRQNLRRSRAAADSYKYEARANEALIEVVNEIQVAGTELESIEHLGVALDRQNNKLNDLRASFEVIPLPECANLRELVHREQDE